MICLTGAGDRAFCAGGDQKQRAETGDYGPSASGLFEIERLHRLIRDVPKPVIAAVNGVAIGGGHVLHVLCDVTVAAEHARFGQVGPRVGSFDAGFGSAYLARVVGEKRAREIWFRCRQYDASTAERWGLVNEVVPGDRLRERSASGLTTCSRCRRPRCGSSSSRSTQTPSTWPESVSSRSAASACSSIPTRPRRGSTRSARSARPTSPVTGREPRISALIQKLDGSRASPARAGLCPRRLAQRCCASAPASSPSIHQ